MNMKENKRNLFVHFVYSVIAMVFGLLLFTLPGGLFHNAKELGLLVPPVMVLISFVVAWVKTKLPVALDKQKLSGVQKILFYGVFCLIFVLGIFFRVQVLRSGVFSLEPYFEWARGFRGFVPSFVHGATSWYVQLMHFLLVLCGNQEISMVLLQMLVQFMCICFWYSVVRGIVGPWPAVVFLGFGMLSPYMVQQGTVANPEYVTLFLVSMAVWLLSISIPSIREEEGDNAGITVGMILTGCMLGVAVYLDILAIAFVPFLFVAVCGRKNKYNLSFTFGMIGLVISILFFIFLDAMLSGESFFAVLEAVMTQYFVRLAPTFAYAEVLTLDVTNVVLAVILLCGIGCGLWSRHRDFTWSIIFTSAIYLLIQCLGINNERVNGSMVGMLLCYMLTAVGCIYFLSIDYQKKVVFEDIKDALLPGETREEMEETKASEKTEETESEGTEKKETAEKVVETDEIGASEKIEETDTDTAAKSTESALMAESVEDVKKSIEPESAVMAGSTEAAKAIEIAERNEEIVVAEAVVEEVKPAEKVAVLPGAPLSNPLPVPKKKEHKSFDYDFDVADDDDYDV